MTKHMQNIASIHEEGEYIYINNGSYQITVAPKHGGKVKSFKSLITGREFLYEDLRNNRCGDEYDGSDQSGWDECFPNIRPCEYSLPPYEGTMLPDHGYIWSKSCDWKIEGEQLILFTAIPEMNASLYRTYTLNEDNRFTIDYKLINHGIHPFVYLTDAHILFAWCDNLEVVLPVEVQKLYVYRSSHWNKVLPKSWLPIDFWKSNETDYNCKVFSPILKEGKIILEYTSQHRESIELLFNSHDLPFIGLWIAKQFTDEHGNLIHCFSVQPTNFASATLPPSEWSGNCMNILPNEEKKWSISLKATAEKIKHREILSHQDG